MAKITRYQGNLLAFASEALGTERTIFGDTGQSDDLTDNITADFLRGWGIVGVNENPTKQDFNGLAYTLGQLLAYLHQAGVPEYDDEQEYFDGSVVNFSGALYQSLADGNIGNDPLTDDVNWKYLLSADDVNYDNSASGATAEDVQAALDELFGSVTSQDQSTWNDGTSTDESVISPLKLDTKIKTLTIGDGQTWQDLTASRSTGVEYTNSTGRSIMVISRSNSITGNNDSQLTIDGLTVYLIQINTGGSASSVRTVVGIVPNGSIYEVSHDGGLSSWWELR